MHVTRPARFLNIAYGVIALAFTLSSSLAESSFRPLARLPHTSKPSSTLFLAQDGFIYGVLTNGVQTKPGVAPGGSVYRVSPTGALTFLHRFPAQSDDYTPNVGGSLPSDVLVMGKDGFLYGLTHSGGTYGHGVFYRLAVNGDYAVLHDFVPREHPFFARGCASFFAGPDDAVYVGHHEKGLVRLGADGSVRVVYAYSNASTLEVIKLDADAAQVAVFWQSFSDRTTHYRVVRLPEGEEIEAYDRAYGVPSGNIFAVLPSEFLLHNSQEIASLDLNFHKTKIRDLSSLGTTPADKIRTLHTTQNGQIYFSAAGPWNGNYQYGGGSAIFTMNREGTIHQIGDLGGYSLGAWNEGGDGHIYGFSFGPTADDAPTPEWYQTNGPWTPGPTVPTRTHTTTPTRRLVFRYSPPGAAENLPPAAGGDHFSLPTRASFTALSLNVLRNDRDPETRATALTISSVGEPRFGSAEIVPATANTAASITYTPAEFPRRSEHFTYVLKDSAGNQSLGQIRLRGDVKGVWRGDALGLSAPDAPLPIAVERLGVNIGVTGKVSGSVKINGETVPLKLTLDYDDHAGCAFRLKKTEVSGKVELAVINVEGKKALQYRIACNAEVFEGTLSTQ